MDRQFRAGLLVPETAHAGVPAAGVGPVLEPDRVSPQTGLRPPRVRRGTKAAPVDLLQVAVMGAILTYIWRIHDLFPVLGAIQLTLVASIVAIGMYTIDEDSRRRLVTVRHPVTTLMCVFLGLALLSVPFSLHDGLSMRFLIDDVVKNFVMTIILAASIRTFEDVRRYILVFLLGAFLYAGHVFLFVPLEDSGRLGDLYYHDANDLGMLLVCSIPLTLFFVTRGRRKWARVMAMAATILFVAVTVRSGSRGAFLGLIAIGMHMLFAFDSISRRARTAAVVTGVIAVVGLGTTQYWEMMNTLLHPQQDYNWANQSETGRLAIWGRGIGYMARRPITGVGVGAFPVAEGTISDMAIRNQGRGVRWANAHNSFVQAGAELGLAALVVFPMMLVKAYNAARRGRRKRLKRNSHEADVLGQALATSVLGFAVTGFFLSQAYGAFTFMLLGLIVGYAKAMHRASLQAAAQGAQRQ